ncbi:MAG TPA: TetR/AcrR family transcriptional regulator [Candidatus Limnocylindria bacterium]|nr:TetR/AcrR family transcriptional regulator [Candidatus Limnocylindria bacterium]
MVRSAASLIRTRGVNATSFSEVLADSGAPRGSIYHHFPNGKEQLAEDAIRWTSERVLAHQRTCRATTPAGVLDCFIDMWRQVVLASDGAAGCVVAGVAIDTVAVDRALIDVVRATFRSWVDLLAEQLVAVGVPARRASRVALTTVAGMEGALILCRAEGHSGPLETVAAEVKRLLPPEVKKQAAAAQ